MACKFSLLDLGRHDKPREEIAIRNDLPPPHHPLETGEEERRGEVKIERGDFDSLLIKAESPFELEFLKRVYGGDPEEKFDIFGSVLSNPNKYNPVGVRLVPYQKKGVEAI
jgi:hypothetical protein